MEYIAPPIKCILEIKMSIQSGLSVKMALQDYLERVQDEFSDQLRLWFSYNLQNNENKSLTWKSYYSKSLVDTIYRGIQGEPILKNLEELEQELVEECKARVDKYMQKLSILSLIPLLFFQFPAFMILLFGPIFSDILEKLA